MAELDWAHLAFKARPTNSLVVSYYRDGQWSVPEVTDNFNLSLSSFAGVFHYASACIEGLKAFRGIDGKVRIFRPGESGERLRSSGAHLDMAVPPVEMFIDMCVMCVTSNIDYLPPYGYDASMYLRPILVGTNSQLGVNSPIDVMLAIMCSPVGTYGGSTGLAPCTAILSRNYDRPAIESEVLTKSYTFGAPDKCGPVSQKLYNCIRDIQEGREEDIHNWCLTF